MKNRKSISVVGVTLVFASVLVLSSCGLFRKKNRCNTCPKWDMIEITTQAIPTSLLSID